VIRSIVLNLVIGVIGLLFVAAGVGYAVEDTAWAGWRGLFHAHAFLLGALNISLGVWCVLGAFRNLRARRRSSPQPLTSPELAAALVSCVMALSLVALVACLWRVEGPDPSPAAFFRYAGRASAVVFIASLIAVPVVATWSASRKAPGAR
jgi:ABC-type thiamin/hydroxymethylpyrimidine transport system permease subunit